MITDTEKWHYLAIKKLSVVFRGLYSFWTKINFKRMRMYVKIMIFFYTEVPEVPKEKENILKYIHGGNSMTIPWHHWGS